jgi:hypothetical protein
MQQPQGSVVPVFFLTNVGFNFGNAKHFVKMKITLPLPEMPIVTGKVNLFEFLECWVSREVLEVACKLVQEKCPDVKHLMCAHRECDKPAVAMCTWYPFVVQSWDGHGHPPVFQNGSPNRVTPWQTFTWCGGKCKMDILAQCMSANNDFREDTKMLGGDFYCFYCGRMQSLDDYESLKQAPLDGESQNIESFADLFLYMAERLPLVVDHKEKLVYCREGECQAKCRQRAPGQLLKLVHENRKKLSK